MSPRAISDETRAEVVRLYREGEKVNEIARRLGVTRPAIYFILQQVGIRPDRQRRRVSPPPEVDVNHLLEQIRLLSAEVGQLRTLLEIREAELAELAQVTDNTGNSR